MKQLVLSIAMLTVALAVSSQDLHYADVQTMNLWYNQSLKLDRHRDIRLNFRDIKYQNLLAFRTASGMLNIPFVKKEELDDNTGKNFFSATAAGAFDKSNNGLFKNATGLLGVSYSVRLTDDYMYLSAGFQGTMTQTSLGTLGALFPDQFDMYGPLPADTRDPLKSGRTYSWMSVNAGLSLYQNSLNKEWYVGASVRHLNRPFTDELKTPDYRMAPTVGMQAGLTVKNESDRIGIYGIANWKAQAYEYLLGVSFAKSIEAPDENGQGGSSIGLGVALRIQDAVIPNLQLKFNKTQIGVHYDMNISGLRAAGYSRQGFEVSLSQRLN